jgi:branched-chain amino acid transport system substrate-binding protein
MGRREFYVAVPLALSLGFPLGVVIHPFLVSTTLPGLQMPLKPPVEIRIGATVSLTGPFAGDVGVFDKIMHSFADLVNRRGGIFIKELGQRVPIKFIIYDDASDTVTAIKFYEKLITEDKVHLLLGPFSSKLTLAVGPVVEKHGVPIIWTAAQAPTVYRQGWKYAVGVLDERPTAWGEPYFVNVLAPLVEKGDIKTIALIHDDTPHSLSVNEGAKILSERIGLKVVFEEKIPFGHTDFSGILAKLRRIKPDIIHFKADSPPSGVAFVRQLKEVNLSPKALYFVEPVPGVLEPLGRDADYLVGATYTVLGVFQGPFGDLSFLAELAKTANVELERWPWFEIYYPAMQAAISALEASDSLKPDDILRALKNLHIMTISGPLRFDEARGFAGTLRPLTVQIFNGRYLVIAPPEFAKASYVHPFKPWDARG